LNRSPYSRCERNRIFIRSCIRRVKGIAQRAIDRATGPISVITYGRDNELRRRLRRVELRGANVDSSAELPRQ
jgi:hypothetical protein